MSGPQHSISGLRVAIVTPTLAPIGGTELYLQSLFEAQRGLGVSARAFVQRGYAAPPVPETASPEISESITLRAWRARSGAVRALAAKLAREHDVVEFHRLAPPDLIRALGGNVATALYLHTPELTCPATGRYLPVSGTVCGRSPGVGCLAVNMTQHCMRTNEGRSFPLMQRLRAPLRGPITRHLLARVDACVFNSHALSRLVHETVGAPRRSFVLEPPLHAPAALPAARNPRRLLFLGRVHDYKGILDAVRAAALLPEFELQVVGDGPARAQAEALAQELGCESRVQFKGWLGRDDAIRACQSAGCLLVPSRWFETWGMTGPEAIAQGCPVVAFDAGGIREWCLPQFGTLVPVGDVQGMAQAARRWCEDSRPRDHWREEALALWGPERFARQYAGILAAIASSKAEA